MKAKPAHLGKEYGAQFQDRSVARAYPTRPPYPAGLFDVLARVITARPRDVLELGAGTGDLTIGLAQRFDRVEAVEPSQAMLELARARTDGVSNVRWVAASAEDHPFGGPYAAVVAAESLHWMEWERVFPKIAAALAPEGKLVLVLVRTLERLPWDSARVWEVIGRYSTNREYRSYDLVAELSARGLFEEEGRQRVVEPGFEQSVEDYVESFHSRNGLSRERMGANAEPFDRELSALVRAHFPHGRIEAEVATTAVWGAPRG